MLFPQYCFVLIYESFPFDIFFVFFKMFLPAIILYLLRFCFYFCKICVTFSPFLLQESFVNVFFQTHLHENAFFYFLSIIINVFFAIFYFCCDFVFIIVNADVTFFLFLSKGLFKRFFFATNSCFFVVFIKMFLPAFFLVATLFL